MQKFKGIDFVFAPAKEAKANILVLHGICEYSLRYSELINYLSEQGLSCAAIDHPGHGKHIEGSENFTAQNELIAQVPKINQALTGFKKASEESRATFQSQFHKASENLQLDEIIDFQKDFLAHLFQDKLFTKDKPLFLLGQSLGGLIAARMSFEIAKHAYPFSGTILLSPAFKPIATHLPGFINNFRYKIEQKFLNKCWSACLGKSPVFSKTILKTALKANPAVDSGRAGDAISDLEEVNTLFKNDPMIGKLISLRFLHSILQSMTKALTKAEEFPKPFLLMYGSHDKIVHSQGAKEFFAFNQKSPNAFSSSQEVCYENFFPHELHNSSKKEEVMQHISDWIKVLVASDSQ